MESRRWPQRRGCVSMAVDVQAWPLVNRRHSPGGVSKHHRTWGMSFPVVGGIRAARLLTVLKRIGGEGDQLDDAPPRPACSSLRGDRRESALLSALSIDGNRPRTGRARLIEAAHLLRLRLAGRHQEPCPA